MLASSGAYGVGDRGRFGLSSWIFGRATGLFVTAIRLCNELDWVRSVKWGPGRQGDKETWRVQVNLIGRKLRLCLPYALEWAEEYGVVGGSCCILISLYCTCNVV